MPIRQKHSLHSRGSDSDEKFKKDDEVWGNYKGKGKWYKGKIKRVNSDGTYNIMYRETGDVEQKVHKKFIRLLYMIFLDLDETILSAQESTKHNFKRYSKKAKKFTFYDMDGYYIIFERPHLQPFLDYIFANFDVSVWTAASKDYALFIIDKIILTKPDRHLDWVFFSYHCDLSKREKGSSKDLSMLGEEGFGLKGYSSNNWFLIDDNDGVSAANGLDNCVHAKQFEFTDKRSEEDRWLKILQRAMSTANIGRPTTGTIKSQIEGEVDGTPASRVNKVLRIEDGLPQGPDTE
jgi:hypothetical protein